MSKITNQFSDVEQAARYLAIIYAENVPGEHILERPIEPIYTERAKALVEHYGLGAVETLIDYTISNGNGGRYGSNPSLRQMADDIILADKWKKGFTK